jgi:hypothetical protein
MVVCICNPAIWEVEVGGLRFEVSQGKSVIPSLKTKKIRNKTKPIGRGLQHLHRDTAGKHPHLNHS